MEFWIKLVEIMDTKGEVPTIFGWYHILCLVLAILAGIGLRLWLKEGTEKQVRTVVLTTAIICILLEIYKQLCFTFSTDGTTITAEFLWYSFPWQFCSMPMYTGLLAGLIKNKSVHKSLCAFLATYAVFAGLCVMIYPGDVFVSEVGINIQTMFCHGSMLTVGIYLLSSGYVKAEHKTILRALPVFAGAVTIAIILNRIAHTVGLPEGHNFNMFFISPDEPPSLPVYSLVQEVVPYPANLLIYVTAFTLAAYIILLIAILVRKIAKKKAH